MLHHRSLISCFYSIPTFQSNDICRDSFQYEKASYSVVHDSQQLTISGWRPVHALLYEQLHIFNGLTRDLADIGRVSRHSYPPRIVLGPNRFDRNLSNVNLVLHFLGC